MRAPPGLLWSWNNDVYRFELSCEIGRHWMDLARNGTDPWAEDRLLIENALEDDRHDLRTFKATGRTVWTQSNHPEILATIAGRHRDPGEWYTAAPTLVENAVLRWRWKDANGSSTRPSQSRQVRAAFEAIVLADELPAAYRFVGGLPPDAVSNP